VEGVSILLPIDAPFRLISETIMQHSRLKDTSRRLGRFGVHVFELQLNDMLKLIGF
jgi:hypothetical protein